MFPVSLTVVWEWVDFQFYQSTVVCSFGSLLHLAASLSSRCELCAKDCRNELVQSVILCGTVVLQDKAALSVPFAMSKYH